MSLIEVPIGQQSYEIIHNRLGGILKEEMDTQSVLQYDPLLEMKLFKERDIPWNDSELPAMNLMFSRGEYEMQTLTQHDGVYRYILEVVGNSKGDGDVLGDQLSMLEVQRILGICRAIVMSPRYVTLGFKYPFICNRVIESIEFGKPVRQDSSHTVLGRMTIKVKAPETVDFVKAVTAAGTKSRVYLNMTSKGYYWDKEFGSVFDDYFDVTFE